MRSDLAESGTQEQLVELLQQSEKHTENLLGKQSNKNITYRNHSRVKAEIVGLVSPLFAVFGTRIEARFKLLTAKLSIEK